MDRYLCVHGHFYQPPRENPWLEAVEVQDSAYPFHDWNERVTAECYEPNTAARILADDGRIEQIISNYSRMSFNFGPTLLAWMKAADPDVYEAILAADRESQERFEGHGSAVAQAYNHMIMPLANDRDRRTQAIWGVRDFEHRFGRKPDGMWLPETAANTASLEALAEQGIRFTIMAPHQAARVRRKGERNWTDVKGAKVDPTRAYEVNLPSGRSIVVFFYDGPVSRAVAFEGLLDNGETFAKRLTSAFDDARGHAQLAHIATDGESYGHHHRYGEMALAYALEHVEREEMATLTNYALFLEKFPPEFEAEIVEDSSWSCVHGVERWRSNCGCNSGREGWNQEWRAPLREALDTLRDAVAPEYERQAAELLKDPWAARDAFIDVILDRSDESLARFLADQAKRELNHDETVRVLELLELQRHAMLMYTSCGWFFDDISGIETVQVIMYAGRVIQLAHDVLGMDPEGQFLDILAGAKSNVPENGDGRQIYEKWVKPAIVDLRDVAAHYAVDLLFTDEPDDFRVYCYAVEPEDSIILQTGPTKLVLGRARFTSDITRKSDMMTYGVLYLGDHNVSGGVRPFMGQEAYDEMVATMREAFDHADYPEIIRLQERHFEGSVYSLRSLFRDEQRRVLRRILQSSLQELEGTSRAIFESHLPLMIVVSDLDYPMPAILRSTAEALLNADLSRELGSENPDADDISQLLRSLKRFGIDPDRAGLSFRWNRRLESEAYEFAEQPGDIEELEDVRHLVDLSRQLPFDVDLRVPQNVAYSILHSDFFRTQQGKASEGDTAAKEWVDRFIGLCDQLSLALEVA